jgi:hypothetical protein
VRPRAAVPVTTASRSFSEGKMAAVVQSIAYHGARKVRQLALCWRVIAFIAHRIGDRTDPDVPAEVRRAVDTESAGPLGHSCDIAPAPTLFTAARAAMPSV